MVPDDASIDMIDLGQTIEELKAVRATLARLRAMVPGPAITEDAETLDVILDELGYVIADLEYLA